MRKVSITLGVPNLGIITEIYDFDDPASCEALDKNVALGCMVLRMEPMMDMQVPKMDLVEQQEQEETTNVVPMLRVVTGGGGPDGNWVQNIPEGHWFLCKNRNDVSNFVGLEYKIINKVCPEAYWLLSHQVGQILIITDRFSNYYKLVKDIGPDE